MLDKYKNKFEIDNIQDFINQEVKPLAGAMVKVRKGNGSIKECENFNFENAPLKLLSPELVTTFFTDRKTGLVNEILGKLAFSREIGKLKKAD